MRLSAKKIILVLITAETAAFLSAYGLPDEFIQAPGLIDIRTDSSDGAHSLEFLVRLAKKRGFRVLFLSDHDRKALEYGVRPFQNILKKKVEAPSINKMGPQAYLNLIQSVSKKFPEMILIPGAESSPFYYWKGSYFKGNLTVCDWERHLLIFGLKDPTDYKELPILHNGHSIKYVFSSIPVFSILLLIPLVLGLYLVKKPGISRYSGAAMSVLCLLLIVNNLPFKSSPYDQYHGYQGISPYQLVIDYVNSRGGMAFWNHPETKSGRGKIDKISRETFPYPQALKESANYAGFAALYGENITITEPGNVWDQVLTEYCQGKRKNPVWGIAAADFHQEGAAGEKLGNFPTIFLVKKMTEPDILDAMKRGKMYACRANVADGYLTLEDFSISDSKTPQRGTTGDEILCQGFPHIRIRVSAPSLDEGNILSIRLVRSGTLLKTFSGQTPLSADYKDELFKPGEKIFYRLDVSDKKGRRLVTNPIFVKFRRADEGKIANAVN
jgi:hypothetical protein